MLPLLYFSPKWNKTLIDQTALRDKILLTPSFQDSSDYGCHRGVRLHMESVCKGCPSECDSSNPRPHGGYRLVWWVF